MNLKVHLLTRIAGAALICLLASASLLLYRSDRQAKQLTEQAAEALGQQLELQLLKLSASLGHGNPFPDFESWKLNGASAGDCVAYRPTDSTRSYGLCKGTGTFEAEPPAGFEAVYRLFFTPGLAMDRPIAYRGRQYGSLTMTPSAKRELAEAWSELRGLMALSASTVLSICVLVYLGLSRALQPAAVIVGGLQAMEQGDRGRRLPPFQLKEWGYIGEAVNQFAATQEQLLAERQELAVRLMGLQEEERRYLARELHDEFGQCLAAVNAISLSIAQSARQHCPELAGEAQQIREITQRMLDDIRGLLRRLRPAELDELGLQASLESLIAGWNRRSQGETRYALSITGDCGALGETLSVALFRVVQECLTNISKHAEAKQAQVALNIDADALALTVTDDGSATRAPSRYGIGLLGMRERISSLNGRLTLGIAAPHGLIVQVWLPVQAANGQLS